MDFLLKTRFPERRITIQTDERSTLTKTACPKKLFFKNEGYKKNDKRLQ